MAWYKEQVQAWRMGEAGSGALVRPPPPHDLTSSHPTPPHPGSTHWFTVEKARRELGYNPVHHDFKPVVQWFLDRGHGLQLHQRKQRASWRHHSASAATARTALLAPAVACAVVLLQLVLTFALGWALGKAAGV